MLDSHGMIFIIFAVEIFPFDYLKFELWLTTPVKLLLHY